MFAGLAMVTLAAASWGTWSLFLRPTHLSALVTSPLLFLIMGLTALPFALRGPRTRWDRETLTLLGLNAAFDALNVLTFFGAISTTTIAIAVLTHYLAPILIALAAPRIDRVQTPGAGPAALVALAGLVIVLEPWREVAEGAALGAVLGVVSAVCYAGNTFVVRRLAERIGAPRAMAYHSLIAAVLMAPLLIGHTDLRTQDVGRERACGGPDVRGAAGRRDRRRGRVGGAPPPARRRRGGDGPGRRHLRCTKGALP